MIREGRAWVFGDNVTTDDIIAGKYKHSTIDADTLARHLMENVRPGFADLIEAGDFIVGGENFGCGSSREQAPQIIRHVGVTAVVARSFARIFYRNAINIGLPLIVADLSDVAEGDQLVFDETCSRLAWPAGGRHWVLPPADPTVRELVAAGGLLAYVRQRGGL